MVDQVAVEELAQFCGLRVAGETMGRAGPVKRGQPEGDRFGVGAEPGGCEVRSEAKFMQEFQLQAKDQVGRGGRGGDVLKPVAEEAVERPGNGVSVSVVCSSQATA